MIKVNYPKQTDNYDVDIFNSNFRELAGDVISLDTAKFDKAEARSLFKGVSVNSKTGVITFTCYDGSVKTIDTLLEKVAVNFDFEPETQSLIITMEDGTAKSVDLSAFITQIEFEDSETVAFTAEDKGTVSAIVKEGSIQEKHLQPNYLAAIKMEAAKAEAGAAAAESRQAAADSEAMAVASAATATQKADSAGESAVAARQKAAEAADSAVAAESFARGGTGSREGEDTDNAAAYYTLSKALIEEAEKLLEQAEKLKYVSTQASQGLTEEEKQNARENIGVPIKTSELTNDSGFGACVHLTQAEYDALPDSKLTDNKLYLITDGGVLGSGDGTVDVPFSKSFVQWHISSSSSVFKEYGDFCEILTKNYQASPRYIFSITGASDSASYGLLSISVDLNKSTITKINAKWLYRSDDIKPENWFITGERIENDSSKLKIRVWKKFERQWEAWNLLPIHITRFTDEYKPFQRNDNGSYASLPSDTILTVVSSANIKLESEGRYYFDSEKVN